MEDLTKYYIDLSKWDIWEKKQIEICTRRELDENKNYPFLIFYRGRWDQGSSSHIKNRTEITYLEFIKLFEGGEGSAGWIKIESEADLPKDEKFWICTSDNRVLISSKSVLNWILKNENNKISHYQPIIKPEPPKF